MPAAAQEPIHPPARSTVEKPSPACRSLGAVSLFALVTAAGLAADLVSKHVAFHALLNDPELMRGARRLLRESPGVTGREVLHQFSRQVFPGVQVTLSTNPGVVFGLSMPRPVVAAATALTIAMVLFFFATTDRRARAVHLAMACILAGAMGNLYDRMFSRVAALDLAPVCNQVRDFIDCSSIKVVLAGRTVNYPYIFNVADVLLVVGVAILLMHWLLAGRRKK